LCYVDPKASNDDAYGQRRGHGDRDKLIKLAVNAFNQSRRIALRLTRIDPGQLAGAEGLIRMARVADNPSVRVDEQHEIGLDTAPMVVERRGNGFVILATDRFAKSVIGGENACTLGDQYRILLKQPVENPFSRFQFFAEGPVDNGQAERAGNHNAA